MKKLILLTFAALFAVTGCKKKEDVVPDIYATFKADATPRWENGTTVEKSAESVFTFVTDAGENLFASGRYKTGRMSSDGSDYEIIEFTGPPAIGEPSDPTLRRPSGTTFLHHLEILQAYSGKLWIVFRETSTSTERRVVQ